MSDRTQRLTILNDYTTMLIAQGQWTRVLRHAKEALRLAPNDAHWLAVQKQAQAMVAPVQPPVVVEQPTVAVTPQQVTNRTAQKTREQWLAEGIAHHDAKRYREAIAAYDHALQLDPNSAVAYARRGDAYRMLKEYQKALSDLDHALQLDPKDAWSYGSRGQVYFALKQYQRAIDDFDRALQLDARASWVKDERDKARRLLEGQR